MYILIRYVLPSVTKVMCASHNLDKIMSTYTRGNWQRVSDDSYALFVTDDTFFRIEKIEIV